MAKRFPKTRNVSSSTRIPILSLSGGVSRQPQTKRLSSEAENIDNALISIERSFEKRPGFEIVNQNTFTGDINFSTSISTTQRIDLFPLEDSGSTDYWFYWFNINDTSRFLIVIDYKATAANQVILRVFQLKTDGTWEDKTQYTASNQQGTAIISANTRAYLTYGSNIATNRAKDVLKATTTGQNIIIVNTLVKAGFTSGTNGNTFTLGGIETGTTGGGLAVVDNSGPLIRYYSSARYTKGANGKWYINTTLTGTTVTVTGSISQGNTITVNTAPTLPSKLEFANPVSNTTNFDSYPSSQNRFYLIQDANNYAILDNWTNAGLSYKVSFVKGNPTTSLKLYAGYPPEVEDFIWHDVAEPWYGQSMVDFSEIRFPPEYAETPAGGGNNSLIFEGVNLDVSAKTALAAINGDSGNGKIYYCSATYLNFASGYYRVISSTSKPYTQKVRSPDLFSILDSKRMPQKIEFNPSATYQWTAKEVSWLPRTSGNRYSNPGPSVFLNSDKSAPRQVSINAISTFRDRLYFAAEDVVFTSQLGIYEDLFFSDPSNIVATDPIDIRASSNTYTEITSLTPFANYLFINTNGGVQYELKGSQNQITPLTAEISPTAFYSTAKFAEPQLLGSLVYFFDKSKLYLYLSSESTNLSIAQELSITCQDYLPQTYRSICIAPAQNMIISVDDANANTLYLHASRFAGDKNLQNAFFRYIINPYEQVMSIKSYDDYLYCVTKLPTTSKITNAVSPTLINSIPDTNTTATNRYYLLKSYLREQSTSIPRLDRLLKIRLYDNNSDYDFTSNQTKIRLPLSFPYQNVEKYQFITDSSWVNDPSGDRVYEIAEPVSYIIKDTYIEFILNGRFVPTVLSSGILTIDYNNATQNPKYIYLGIKYKMEVELSKLFVRDQENNTIDGMLSLRSIVIKHKNTGNYNLEVLNRGRESIVSSYTNQKVDSNEDPLNLENFINEGEFTSPILGFSDNVTLKITSEYPTPVNIINMEVKGKFIQKYSSLTNK